MEDKVYLKSPHTIEIGTFSFFDLKGSREAVRSKSYVNVPEAVFSVFITRRLMQYFESSRTIAIITPYKAQAQLVRSYLTPEERSCVEVNTVDGFQGREKDAVIFSCVRDGIQGGIGFLADERRLNVGITRARAVLAIVGSSLIGRRNSTWKSLIESARSRCRLISVDTV